MKYRKHWDLTTRKQKALSDLSIDQRERIGGKLTDLMSICEDMTVDEMGWIGAACLRLIVMKVEKSSLEEHNEGQVCIERLGE
jgi:hypothetical protein